jgi:hypothetical protein
MNRALAIVLALGGCDEVYNLTRPPDARVDAAIIDSIDAPPGTCDLGNAGPASPIPAKGTQIVAGKFNADSAVDLAVGSTNSSQLWVHYNDNGGFSTVSNVDVGEPVLALASGDLNNDGLDDIAFVTATTANGLLQTASTWDRKMVVVTGGAPRTVALANFDGDGLLDMVVSIPSGALVRLVLGNTTAYLLGTAIPTGSSMPVAAIPMDVDMDLDPDIVTALESDNAIRPYLDNGANFGAGQLFATGMKPVAIAAARLGDRVVTDLVVVNEASNNVAILRNDGHGSFVVESLAVGMSPQAIAIADLNRDGYADLIVANQKSNSVSVLRGTPTSFEQRRDYTTVPKPVALAVADFTDDDQLDLAVLGEEDGFVIHETVCAPF